MRRTLPLALLAAMLVPGLALASGFYPPADATLTPVGEATVAHWVGDEPAAAAADSGARGVTAGETATLWFGVPRYPNASANATQAAYVNVTLPELGVQESLLLTLDTGSTADWSFESATFATSANATDAAYTFTVEIYLTETIDEGNASRTNTTLAAAGNGAGLVRIVAPQPPAPGIPTSWIVGGAAAVLVAGGAGYVVVQRRREQARINQPRRSQALREEALERAAVKKPEEAAVIQAEIRQEEKVRERRRELQILDAKRADALKSIDLLRKRHETGALTKLQFDTMVAKKQADLERIEAEIAEMEAADSSGSAAA